MSQAEYVLKRTQDPVMGSPVVAFDMDGTICENGPKIDFQDGLSVMNQCKPKQFVIQRIRALWASGTCHIAVITARDWKLSGVTHDQLRKWLGDEVFSNLDVVHSDLPSMKKLPAHIWYEWCKRYKARELKDLDALVYVGDTSIDQMASNLAGCSFQSAYQFGRGDAIPGLQVPGRC